MPSCFCIYLRAPSEVKGSAQGMGPLQVGCAVWPGLCSVQGRPCLVTSETQAWLTVSQTTDNWQDILT